MIRDLVWWQTEHNRQLGLEWREYIPVEHDVYNAEYDCEFFNQDMVPELGWNQNTVPPLYIKVE